ncbi:MAG: tetrahydromethanopterin S-methyltransferase subunit C [Methanimicrococcus sp.]|nr:tetrahydromethanopterin S-methyltransferase subunit C [Methanimicrococcus sp.]
MSRKQQSVGSTEAGRMFFLYKKPAFYGLFLSLAGIYLSQLLPSLLLYFSQGRILVPQITFSIFAGIGMVAAIVWAAGAVRRVAKYGLGTGVPSIGMFGIGLAVLITTFSLSFDVLYGPLIGVFTAIVLGGTGGFLSNKVLQMKIPSFEIRMIEIVMGLTLAFIASAVVVTGSFDAGSVFTKYVASGVVAFGFIGCSLAVFHAYNSNLGPDESLDRTLTLAVLDGFLVLFVFGIVSLLSGDLLGPSVTIFMSLVFIILSYVKYWNYVQRDVCSIQKTGLLPSEEELD